MCGNWKKTAIKALLQNTANASRGSRISCAARTCKRSILDLLLYQKELEQQRSSLKIQPQRRCWGSRNLAHKWPACEPKKKFPNVHSLFPQVYWLQTLAIDYNQNQVLPHLFPCKNPIMVLFHLSKTIYTHVNILCKVEFWYWVPTNITN